MNTLKFPYCATVDKILNFAALTQKLGINYVQQESFSALFHLVDTENVWAVLKATVEEIPYLSNACVWVR
jgi:hypothetical protein